VAGIVSELATNAVTHTESGRSGGRFSVELAWSPGLLRIVVGDQGAPSPPRLVEEAGGTSGRGLLIVDQLSQTWGVAGDPAGRWVWADVPWPGGPPTQVPGSNSSVGGELARLRRAYPGVPAWYGHATRTWWAALPETGIADELISAPSPTALDRMLAGRHIHRPVHDAEHIPAEYWPSARAPQ
jgi:hypothetical protein